jgi:formyl-CoA transferase
MTKPLEGVRILDFTHVQAGPVCTQLLAWFGADVIKVERSGTGDVTRSQLRDIPDVDSLYFTMMNGNKRSITLDTKNPDGHDVLEALIKICDVLVENFAPGALDRMGFTWEKIHAINPKIIVASVKGFGPGRFEDCKAYENVAQCAGGAASTTGFRDGIPLVTGAGIGDSGTGVHLRWASSRRCLAHPLRERTAGVGVDAGCGTKSLPREAAGSAAACPRTAVRIQPIRRGDPVSRHSPAVSQ